MGEKKKILVVEDEKDIQKYLTTLFEDNGYDCITADDGIAGLDVAKSEKPDLITLDIAMPNQTGVRTFRKYKEMEELKDIPVVIVTGVGDSMQIFFAKLKGFSKPEGFMNKPIDEQELLNIVKDLI